MKNMKINVGIWTVSCALMTSLAFKPAETRELYYWFEVAENGLIGEFQGISGPSPSCDSEATEDPYCSVAFEQEKIGPDLENPVAPIENVTEDPSMLIIDDLRHKQEL